MKDKFKKTLPFIVIVFTFTLFFSCRKNEEEELRKKENKALQEFLDKTTLTFYKAIKVALRSSADSAKHPEISAAGHTMLKLGLAGATMLTDSTKSVNPVEIILLAKDFYKAKNVLNKTNEDDLPTVLENLGILFKGHYENPEIFGMKYDNNFEHVLLGILWTITMKAPTELSLYEMDKAESKSISQIDLKLFTELCKSLSYSLNDFWWHSLDESGAFIKDLEANKDKIVSKGIIPFGVGEKSYYEMLLLGHALHGCSELQLEKEDEALKDFELVLSDAEKCGMDNEITWLVGLYVHTKKEENEKAIQDIDKLLSSQQFSDSEKAALKEAKSYLEAKENGKAFNKVRDKLAIWKIEFHYAQNRLQELQAIQDMKRSREGKRLYELHQNLNEGYGYVQKISVGADSLASSAKGLVKDLFNRK